MRADVAFKIKLERNKKMFEGAIEDLKNNGGTAAAIKALEEKLSGVIQVLNQLSTKKEKKPYFC